MVILTDSYPLFPVPYLIFRNVGDAIAVYKNKAKTYFLGCHCPLGNIFEIEIQM